ncbi:MAG: hypothetical protein Q7S00_03725 [bacterium]|nr:hypothetical protein [bacterium]
MKTELRNLITAHSPWLARPLLQKPPLLEELIQSPFFEKEKPLSLFLEEANVLSGRDLAKELFNYQQKELLRIGLKALGQNFSLKISEEEIGRELAHLAQAVVEKSAAVCEEPFKAGLTCIGLGKLGGEDLNFSSDIDLLFLYESDEPRSPTLSAHEFYVKGVEKWTHFLRENRFYRIDLDLRPEGKKGTLTNSLLSLEYYYETWGAEWERLALIKSRCVAGQKNLTTNFLKRVDPFVWRKNFDAVDIERIKQLKEKASENLKTRFSQAFHVKLGQGGIREIEFFVSIFQLLWGGKHPALKETHTLTALRKLSDLKIIAQETAHQLENAYLFLRKIENRLQMRESQQTHQIPSSPEGQKGLARLMGYHQETGEAAQKAFLEDLEKVRALVQKHYGELFA